MTSEAVASAALRILSSSTHDQSCHQQLWPKTCKHLCWWDILSYYRSKLVCLWAIYWQNFAARLGLDTLWRNITLASNFTWDLGKSIQTAPNFDFSCLAGAHENSWSSAHPRQISLQLLLEMSLWSLWPQLFKSGSRQPWLLPAGIPHYNLATSTAGKIRTLCLFLCQLSLNFRELFMCKVHLETFRTSWCSSLASGSSGWIRLGLKFPESDAKKIGRRTMKNLTFLNLQG